VTSLAELYGWRESRRSPDGREVWLNWIVRRRDSREAVGYAQATVHPSHAYVAWVIGTSWQGRGYASESAGRLVRWLRSVGVHEIRACVNPAHAASGTVALRAGLRRTAVVQDGEEVWICRPPSLPDPDR
jgi:RimJ/RimL family protein N-acetyltransferase